MSCGIIVYRQCLRIHLHLDHQVMPVRSRRHIFINIHCMDTFDLLRPIEDPTDIRKHFSTRLGLPVPYIFFKLYNNQVLHINSSCLGMCSYKLYHNILFYWKYSFTIFST